MRRKILLLGCIFWRKEDLLLKPVLFILVEGNRSRMKLLDDITERCSRNLMMLCAKVEDRTQWLEYKTVFPIGQKKGGKAMRITSFSFFR